MQYDDLLGKSWACVETKNRRVAMRRAFTAGRSLAETALVSNGGSDLLNCILEMDLTDFYFHYLIEDHEFYDELHEEDRKYWSTMQRQDTPSDPRIHSFSQGWLAFMADEIVCSSPRLKAHLSDLSLTQCNSVSTAPKTDHKVDHAEPRNSLINTSEKPRRVG
jgi:hypothetical protein